MDQIIETDKEWIYKVNNNFLNVVAPQLFEKLCDQRLDEYNAGKITFDQCKEAINKASQEWFNKPFITEESYNEWIK